MGFTQKLGLLAQGVYSDSSLNVGIGGAPSGSYKFETTGTAKISSTLLVSGVVTFGSTLSNGTYTYTLPSATGTLALTSAIPANPVGGTGTTNYLPKFTAASTIGNSIVYDDGNTVFVNAITAPALGNPKFFVKMATANSYEGILVASSSNNHVIAIAHTGSLGLITTNYGTSGSSTNLGFGTGGATQMTLDTSGNLGLGVTPSAWGASLFALQTQGGAVWSFTSAYMDVWQNAYYNGTNSIYTTTAAASYYRQSSGEHIWYTAPSGTAGNAITFTERMRMTSDGNVGIGVTPSAWGNSFIALQLGPTSNIHSSNTGNETRLANNLFWDGTAWKYLVSSVAGTLVNLTSDGNYNFFTAPSGTAGASATLTSRMLITNGGNVLIGSTTDGGAKLQVNGRQDADGIIRSTSSSAASAGSGAEIAFSGGIGYFLAYNRTTSTYLPVGINGSTVTISTGSATPALTIASTGESTFSSSIAVGGAGMGLTGINLANGNYIAWYASGTSGPQYVALRGNSSNLELSSGGGLTMTLDASQRVGIGATSPVEKFQVSGGRIYAEGTGTSTGITWANYNIYQDTSTNLIYRYGTTEIFRFATTGVFTFTSTATSSGTFQSSAVVPYWVYTSTTGGGTGYIGFGNSLISGASNSDFVIRSDNALKFAIGGTAALSIAATGAATFSGGQITLTGTAAALMQIVGTTTYSYTQYSSGTNTMYLLQSQNGVSTNGSTAGAAYFYMANSQDFQFNWAGTTKATITSAGNLTIVGALSKGSGSFRIEHPLPSLSKTHHLVHSFIEGPQADLIYRGKLTLVNGKAQANIDEVSTMTEGTFEVLCREIQCFTTNESGWDLVKGKVIGNIIYIESQNKNSTDEISWMVIGERKDEHMMDTDWTDENGKVIVEPLKPIEPEQNNNLE